MKSKRWLVLGAALAALAGAILVAGCGGGDDESGVTAYCDKLEELQSEPEPFSGLQEGDLDGAKDALADYRDKIQEVADVAPEEIQNEIDQLQSVFDEFNDSIQDVDAPQDALGILSELQGQGAEIAEVSARLTAYTEENCGEESG